MAKPKKKRDLRARLGRTITPKTQGGDDAAPPPAAGAGAPAAEAATPAPAATAAAPAAAAAPTAEAAKPKPKLPKRPGGVTPPPSGVAAPPAGIGGGGGGGLVAPPFAKPEPQQPAAPVDPFAAAAQPAGPQVVRLEFDDRLVEDAEVGKTQRFKLILVALVVGAAALVVGYFGGSTAGENEIFEQTVRDAQTIHHDVEEASATVNRAQTLLNQMVRAAAGNPQANEAPAVDYEAIESLRALEKPIDAAAMAGKNYKALPANVTNALFTYLSNVERLWAEFRSLVATTLPEGRRAELDRTATETAEAATTRYGAVLRRIDGGELVVSLAFLSINETDDGVEIVAHGRRGDRGRQMQLWDGEAEITDNPEYLISVDGDGSRGVLAEQTGAFGEYLTTITRLKLLADATVEAQGQIISGIAQALSEAGASTSPTE